MSHPTLFDLAKERRDREEAIARVNRNAAPDWADEFYEAVRTVARSRKEFTTRDVRTLYDLAPDAPQTHEPRAIGAVMRRAQREGLIVKTERFEDTGTHCAPQRVWRSMFDV